MKPFNLEDALKGKPVCTRDGRSVKIAGHNPDSLSECTALVGWVEDKLNYWTADGTLHSRCFQDLDLFMVSEKHKITRFMLSYDPDAFGHETKEEAEKFSRGPGAHLVEVTLEWED